MNNSLKKVIKLVFSIALLAILFNIVDFNEIFLKLKESNIKILAFPAIIYFIGLFLSAKKWREIFKIYGLEIKSKNLFKLYLIGSFYNNFLPSSIGGDGYKFIELNKKNRNKKKEILSSILLERGFGFLGWYLLNIVMCFVFFKEILLNNFLLTIEIFLLLSPIFFFALIKFSRFLFKDSKLFNKFYAILETLSSIKNKISISIYAFILSLLINLLTIISIYIIFLSLGLEISLSIIAFCMSLIVIYSIVPISFNNIGFTESLSVILFSIFIPDKSIILLTFLIARSISILLSLSGWFILIYESIKR